MFYLRNYLLFSFQYSNDNSSGSTICNHHCPSPQRHLHTPMSLRNQRLTSSSPNLNRACMSPRNSRQFQPIPNSHGMPHSGQPLPNSSGPVGMPHGQNIPNAQNLPNSGGNNPMQPINTTSQLIYDNSTVLTNLDCRNHSTIVQPPLCNNVNSQPMNNVNNGSNMNMNSNANIMMNQSHQYHSNQTLSNQTSSHMQHSNNSMYWNQQHQQHRHSVPNHMSYHQPHPMYPNQMCNQSQSAHHGSMNSMSHMMNVNPHSPAQSSHNMPMSPQHMPASPMNQHNMMQQQQQQQQQANMMQSPYCPPQPLTSPNIATPAPTPAFSQQQAARQCNCNNAQCELKCSGYDRMNMRRCSAPASLSANQNKDILQSNEVSQSNMRQSTYQRTLEYVEQCQQFNWNNVSSSTQARPVAATDNMVINDMNTSLNSLRTENQYFQMSQMIQ